MVSTAVTHMSLAWASPVCVCVCVCWVSPSVFLMGRNAKWMPSVSRFCSTQSWQLCSLHFCSAVLCVLPTVQIYIWPKWNTESPTSQCISVENKLFRVANDNWMTLYQICITVQMAETHQLLIQQRRPSARLSCANFFFLLYTACCSEVKQ